MQMILNRNFLFLVIIALLAAGCAGTDDDSSKLEQLKKEREALDKQIRQLEQQIIADGGTVEETSRVPAVVAEKVEPEVFNHYIEVRGSVESDQNIFVPAQRPYMVEKIYVDEGDYVTKGQLMAELDNESIRQSIREVKNGLELATTLFERQENLWEKNIGTEVQYLQAKNRMEDLQIKLRNVETELEKTRIFSPIDGVVDYVAIKEGEAAVPNMGAIRVSNMSAQKVKARVAENYISNIKRGDKIKVYFPVIDLEMDAEITAVAQVIDPNNRTFDIEVDLPDDNRINPNMLAILTVNDYTNFDAFVLPINALQQTEDRSYVYLAREVNGQWIAEQRDVETGRYSGDEVEITGGLASGDVVIVFGFNKISVGEPIGVSFNRLQK
ncbi:MAG: efflux RND transporter periplasmic adaptor subunit [Bacteroidales bacterium]